MAVESLQWTEQAACDGMDTDVFFADSGEAAATAIAICSGCPVRERCLRQALNPRRPEMFGIWGGTLPEQRRAMLRREAAGRPGTAA